MRTQAPIVNEPLGYSAGSSGTSMACCAPVNENAWPEVKGANPAPPIAVPSCPLKESFALPSACQRATTPEPTGAIAPCAAAGRPRRSTIANTTTEDAARFFS